MSANGALLERSDLESLRVQRVLFPVLSLSLVLQAASHAWLQLAFQTLSAHGNATSKTNAKDIPSCKSSGFPLAASS